MPSGRARLPHGDVLWVQGVPVIHSPSAPVPPGTPEACPGIGQETLFLLCAPPTVSWTLWGIGLGVLGMQGMEKQDTLEASCCSTGSSWGTYVPGAMCGINAKAMPGAQGPYSLGMTVVCWAV